MKTPKLKSKFNRLLYAFGLSDERKFVAAQIDREFYLLQKPILPSGTDPVEHYVTTGWKEGRDPSPWFSTRGYLERHADVRQSGLNPFFHYLKYGRSEMRAIVGATAAVASSAKPGTPEESTFVLSTDERLAIAREFDAGFYRSQYSDVSGSDLDLIEHYCKVGWREGRDPSPSFSTSFYLERYGDIRTGKLNPYYHYVMFGRAEGRLPKAYFDFRTATADVPGVSVIVPNFNHARFLDARLRSITSQKLKPDEIIILDDASTDDSRQVIERFARESKIPVRVVFNDQNSGNVFRQWEKGVSLARSPLIWICESDDLCESTFLSVLAPHFCDPSVMVAFGRIEFADESGRVVPGMDGYRESAAKGFWTKPRVASAVDWFEGALGVRNVMANVGGCLFRRQTIEQTVWREAQTYRVCGDWYLYTHLARGGRIAFDPDAVAYFRQHQANTSVKSFKRLDFYGEHARIAREMRRLRGVSDGQTCRMYSFVLDQFRRHFPKSELASLYSAFNLNEIIEQKREQTHILIGTLGFHTGGGEIFPINLANALVARGHTVSMLVIQPDKENADVRARLDSRIAIYERQLVDEVGAQKFLEEFGFDLVHTHFIGVDSYLHRAAAAANVPYVVTHHGSYEISKISTDLLFSMLRIVDRWVYLSEKNLEPFKDLPIDRSMFVKLPNAVPVSDAPFASTRADLGIGAEDFVFALASRALKSKGWDVAIEAFDQVARQADRRVHLLLCGDGPDFEDFKRAGGDIKGVQFLGYQREIVAFYRLADCCLLPTRFKGESYPLTLLEALQAERPIIATDVGEIGSMLEVGDQSAGILVTPHDDDTVLVASVAAAMMRMLEDSEHARYAAAARALKPRYDFDALVGRYEEVYRAAMARRSKA